MEIKISLLYPDLSKGRKLERACFNEGYNCSRHFESDIADTGFLKSTFN